MRDATIIDRSGVASRPWVTCSLRADSVTHSGPASITARTSASLGDNPKPVAPTSRRHAPRPLAHRRARSRRRDQMGPRRCAADVSAPPARSVAPARGARSETTRPNARRAAGAGDWAIGPRPRSAPAAPARDAAETRRPRIRPAARALIEPSRPFSRVDDLAELLQFVGPVTPESHAQNEAAAAELVQRRGLARELVDPPTGERCDQGPEPQRGGGARDRAQGDPRIGNRTHRRPLVDVIPQEDPVPATLLRARGELVKRGQEQSALHVTDTFGAGTFPYPPLGCDPAAGRRCRVRIAVSPACFISTSWRSVAVPRSANRRFPPPSRTG